MESARFSRILCVSDNVQLFSTLEVELVLHGFEIVTATHGIDALMQYKAHQGNFKAILTDNEMPHAKGLEFDRGIREMGFKGRIVIAFGDLKPETWRTYLFNALPVPVARAPDIFFSSFARAQNFLLSPAYSLFIP